MCRLNILSVQREVEWNIMEGETEKVTISEYWKTGHYRGRALLFCANLLKRNKEENNNHCIALCLVECIVIAY